MNKIINWIMLISLIVVFASGIALRPFPSMLLGITHALSGLLLVISVLFHIKSKSTI